MTMIGYARCSTAKAAHLRVLRAVRCGQLVRPDTCQKCGKTPKADSAGRAGIHGHHHRGYENPLDVEWICARCHRLEPDHTRRGETHGRAKLTEFQVLEIRERVKSGGSRRALAREYGVAQRTIQSIERGIIWKHL